MSEFVRLASDLLLRVAAGAILLIAVGLCIRALFFVALPPASGLIVRPFEFLDDKENGKAKGELLAKLIADRINAVQAILSTDLREHSSVLVELAQGTVLLTEPVAPTNTLLEPQLEEPIDVSFGRPFDLDVAGFLDYFRQRLYRGDTLYGVVELTADGYHIHLEGGPAREHNRLGPWPEAGLSLEDLSDRIGKGVVHAHLANVNSAFGLLEPEEFGYFLEGLTKYQAFALDLAKSSDLESSLPALLASNDSWVKLSESGSPIAERYLRNVQSIVAALRARTASLPGGAAIGSGAQFETGVRNILSATDPTNMDPLLLLRAQDALVPIQLGEALKLFESRLQVRVGIMAGPIYWSEPSLAGRVLAAWNFGESPPQSFATGLAMFLAAIAPNAEIVPLPIPSSDTDMSSILEFALDQGVRVVLMPYGTYKVDSMPSPYDPAEQEAISRAVGVGLTVIASAGNAGSAGPAYNLAFPAAYDEVIAVGATQADDQLVPESSYGDWVTLYAPGASFFVGEGEEVSFQRGLTAAAAAVVAGVASLAIGQNPQLARAALGDHLSATAEDVSTKNPRLSKALRVNALEAVKQAR